MTRAEFNAIMAEKAREQQIINCTSQPLIPRGAQRRVCDEWRRQAEARQYNSTKPNDTGF